MRLALLVLILWLNQTACCAQVPNAPKSPESKPQKSDYGTPVETMAAFLRAVKANDLERAKSCWYLSDGNASGVLDVLIGGWIAEHRLNQAIHSRFSKTELREFEHWSHSDEAIDRTMRRLKDGKVEIKGDTAKLRIHWQPGDQYEKPAFMHSSCRPVAWFRRVNGQWKMDGNKEIGFRRPADYLQPKAWFYQRPSRAPDRVRSALEAGKLKTTDELKQAYLKEGEDFEREMEAGQEKQRLSPVETLFFMAWNVTLRFELEFAGGRESLWGLCLWSRRLLDAELKRSTNEAERLAAAQAHLDRMKEAQIETLARVSNGTRGAESYYQAADYRAEAQLLLASINAKTERKGAPLEATAIRQASAFLIVEQMRQALEEGRPLRSFSWGAYCQRRLVESFQVPETPPAERRRVAASAVEFTTKMEDLAKKYFADKRTTPQEVSRATYERANMEIVAATWAPGPGQGIQGLDQKMKDRLEAAKAAYEGLWLEYCAGRGNLETMYEWSVNWHEAALALAKTRAERVALAEAHLERMRKLVPLVQSWEKRVPSFYLWACEFYVAEAKIILANAKEK